MLCYFAMFQKWRFRNISKNEISEDSEIVSVDTERFIINPQLGLKGKIDAVVKMKEVMKKSKQYPKSDPFRGSPDLR